MDRCQFKYERTRREKSLFLFKRLLRLFNNQNSSCDKRKVRCVSALRKHSRMQLRAIHSEHFQFERLIGRNYIGKEQLDANSRKDVFDILGTSYSHPCTVHIAPMR